MPGYQSYFAASPSTASSGGGYKSYFGTSTIAQPTAAQLAASRANKQPVKPQAPAPKPQSMLSKAVTVGKSLASGATAGEQTVAKGVARILPGGLNDVNAQQQQATGANQNVVQTIAKEKSGQISKAKGNSIIQAQAGNAAGASTAQAKTVKAMPTKGQLAAGFGSTAADLLTAGTLPELKGSSLLAKGANVASKGAAYGSAGLLNAASSGQTGKPLVESTVLGAALPGAAHVVGKVVAPTIAKATDKLANSDNKAVTAVRSAKAATGRDQPTNSLITNAKTQSLLNSAPQDIPKTITAQVNPDHVSQGLVHPDIKQTKVSDISIPADNVHKLDSAKVAQYTKQIKDGEPIEPIVTHQINGQTHVVDGQNRLAAAQKAGFDTVPTVDKVPGAVPVTTQSVPEVASPIAKAIIDSYKGGKAGSEEEAALHYLTANPDKAMKDYDDRVKDKFGATNVVSGDEAKYIIPGFDSTKSATFHEPASALAKVKYTQLLADDSTKNKPVLLMSGGSGAGKTSALKRMGIDYHNYAAVIDTNSNKLESTESRIQQAKASGRAVEVFHVHRDPEKAFQGVLDRGSKEGRIVPIENHLETHYGSHDTIQKLNNTYKDDPFVDVSAASNDHGHGKAQELDVDKIPQMKYTKEELRTKLQKAVDNAHTTGQINDAEHALYHGSDTVAGTRPDLQTVESKAASTSDKQPEQQRPAGQNRERTESEQSSKVAKAEPETGASKIAQDVQAKAVAKNLTTNYGEVAHYNKINVAEEANKAVKFVNGDKDKLMQVIRGDKPLPSDLRATAVIKAVEEHPQLGKDGEVLTALAKSPLNTESSRSAQELRLAAERDQNSAVNKISELSKTRSDAFKAKTGKTVAKATSDELKSIRAAKLAAPKTTKETFASFVESLKC